MDVSLSLHHPDVTHVVHLDCDHARSPHVSQTAIFAVKSSVFSFIDINAAYITRLQYMMMCRSFLQVHCAEKTVLDYKLGTL